MSGDLISRGDLLDEIEKARLNNKHTDAKSRNQHNQEYTHFGVIANRQPTVEAVPVLHAEWIDDTGCLDSVRQYKCSNCGRKPIVNMNYVSILSDFCPNCGAKMDGGKE